MRKILFTLASLLAAFSLLSCKQESEQTVGRLDQLVRSAEAGALETIVPGAKTETAFFTNPEFSQRQADFLTEKLSQLPEPDKDCVETRLRDSFDERMVACETSGKMEFICGGCTRLSNSILYDPRAIMDGMQLCGVDTDDLPEWR